jgi:hypothetical protein
MDERAGTEASQALRPLSSTFAATRASLHRVAEKIVAPARKPDNEIALQATPRGFGTPPFEFEGEERQVRVEGNMLVSRIGAEEHTSRITSLAATGALVSELLPPDAALDDSPLDVDQAAARALGDWYALGATVLGELVAEADPDDAPTPVNLWPEHFDLAIELGSEAAGARANYGFSPGDHEHSEPYLYIGPWTAEVEGELWRANGFRGAELDYGALVAADDPRAMAIDFCRTRKQALAKER